MPLAEKAQQEDRCQRHVITADLELREMELRLVSSGSRTDHTYYRYEIRNQHQEAEDVQDQKNSTVGETRSDCTEGTVAHWISWLHSFEIMVRFKKRGKINLTSLLRRVYDYFAVYKKAFIAEIRCILSVLDHKSTSRML